jgi:hypothetical protein
MTSYVSLRSRASAAVFVLGVVVVIDVCRFISGLMQRELLDRMATGSAFSMEEATDNDSRVQTLAVLYLIALIVSGVTFLRWFHRAASNHDSFRGIDEGSGQSAVWSFFIPFLNLIRPYQMMKSVWQGIGYAEERGSSSMVSFWWATWLASGLLSYLGRAFMETAGSDASGLASATLFDMVNVSVNALSAVLAILLVRGVTVRQEGFAKLGLAEAFD